MVMRESLFTIVFFTLPLYVHVSGGRRRVQTNAVKESIKRHKYRPHNGSLVIPTEGQAGVSACVCRCGCVGVTRDTCRAKGCACAVLLVSAGGSAFRCVSSRVSGPPAYQCRRGSSSRLRGRERRGIARSRVCANCSLVTGFTPRELYR